MPLDDILHKIDENAALKAQDIESKANAEVGDIIRKAKDEAAQQSQRIIKQESQRLAEVSRRDIVMAKLKGKEELLREKRLKVDLCFEKALDGIIKLEDGLYRRLIQSMLVSIGSFGKAEIIFSFNDKSRISAEFIHKINPGFTLVFSDELKKGFILKSKEVVLNNSFDKTLSSMRQDWEPKVAQILFKE